MISKSLVIAKKYLGKKVSVKIDRPLGSVHPRFNNIVYTSNYGYLEGVKVPDGGDLDVYVLKVNEPLKKFIGKVVAVIHRLNDDDDKLVVIPENQEITDEEIEKDIKFQEKWQNSKHIIIH